MKNLLLILLFAIMGCRPATQASNFNNHATGLLDQEALMNHSGRNESVDELLSLLPNFDDLNIESTCFLERRHDEREWLSIPAPSDTLVQAIGFFTTSSQFEAPEHKIVWEPIDWVHIPYELKGLVPKGDTLTYSDSIEFNNNPLYQHGLIFKSSSSPTTLFFMAQDFDHEVELDQKKVLGAKNELTR